MNVRRHFFTAQRVAGLWNSLPPSIVNFSSLLLFKKTINNGHVNLFTRYCSLICLCSLQLCIVIISFLPIAICIITWYVSGLWPFIDNKSSSPITKDHQRLPLMLTRSCIGNNDKKLSYRRGTARRAMLVNSCYVSRGMEARKAAISKSDLQGHSRALAMMPFDMPYTISYYHVTWPHPFQWRFVICGLALAPRPNWNSLPPPTTKI